MYHADPSLALEHHTLIGEGNHGPLVKSHSLIRPRHKHGLVSGIIVTLGQPSEPEENSELSSLESGSTVVDWSTLRSLNKDGSVKPWSMS